MQRLIFAKNKVKQTIFVIGAWNMMGTILISWLQFPYLPFHVGTYYSTYTWMYVCTSIKQETDNLFMLGYQPSDYAPFFKSRQTDHADLRQDSRPSIGLKSTSRSRRSEKKLTSWQDTDSHCWNNFCRMQSKCPTRSIVLLQSWALSVFFNFVSNNKLFFLHFLWS